MRPLAKSEGSWASDSLSPSLGLYPMTTTVDYGVDATKAELFGGELACEAGSK